MAATNHLTLAFGLTLLATACASGGGERPAPLPSAAASAAVASVSAGPAISAAAYLSNAASIDLFEIRSANVALQRSSNPRIRDFANMMIAAHRGTSSQLSLAGRRLNLLPAAHLNGRHEAMMAELVASSDFDAAYRRLQIQVHEEALALHRGFESRGASPTLRPVAASAVPIIERHIRMLRSL
jgi:putative membrane protein